MKKKIMAMVLMASTALMITACGGGNSGSNGGPASNEQTNTESKSEESEGSDAAGTEYVFEAEYTYLEGLEGLGVSGSPTGTGLAAEAAKASNGFYLGNLGKSSPTTYKITSDADATATLKITAGSNLLGSCTWNPTSFVITVNGTAMDYKEFQTADGSDADNQQNFKTVTLGEIELKSGENEIVLMAGDNGYRSNMPAAPSIDCIKIITDASLTMEEYPENIE